MNKIWSYWILEAKGHKDILSQPINLLIDSSIHFIHVYFAISLMGVWCLDNVWLSDFESDDDARKLCSSQFQVYYMSSFTHLGNGKLLAFLPFRQLAGRNIVVWSLLKLHVFRLVISFNSTWLVIDQWSSSLSID